MLAFFQKFLFECIYFFFKEKNWGRSSLKMNEKHGKYSSNLFITVYVYHIKKS